MFDSATAGSPGGREIAFFRDRIGPLLVWTMDADGGNAAPPGVAPDLHISRWRPP